MDEQAKINKYVVTKFKAMEKILENLDGKVTDVGNPIREVFIMMKMRSGTTCRAPDGQQKRIFKTIPRSQEGEGYSYSFGRVGGSH
jgi:hypothetical protein